MAQAPQQPRPPAPAPQAPNTASQFRQSGGMNDALPTAKQRYQDRIKQEAEADKKADDIAYMKATQGIPDEDTMAKVIALGGDASRSSPAMEQNLGDPQPGLTTTTGTYRSPMDPTTADVPADPESDFVKRAPRGFPALKEGKKSQLPAS